MTIQLSDTIVNVCSNAADILQCHCTTVTLGYTAPWFKKMGTKVQLLYLDTDADLDELAHGIEEFTTEQKKKQYKKNIACKIILHNMNDETVSFTSFFLLCFNMMSILPPFQSLKATVGPHKGVPKVTKSQTSPAALTRMDPAKLLALFICDITAVCKNIGCVIVHVIFCDRVAKYRKSTITHSNLDRIASNKFLNSSF